MNASETQRGFSSLVTPGLPDYHECYQMQVHLARDGWPKKFVEVGEGRGVEFLTRLAVESGRNIQVRRASPDYDGSTASAVPNGDVNFVFVDVGDDYVLNLRTIEAWWPKIRISGWIGGHDINMPGVRLAVTELFRAQYEQDDPMLRIVQIGRSWMAPKFHEPINFPFNQNYFK